MFKLILVDTNKKLCDAWKKAFSAHRSDPMLDIVHSKFEDIEQFDSMVSPANSFGLMDGGIDKAIVDHFGQQLMDRVQEMIMSNYYGEQPVGTSMLVQAKEGGFLTSGPFIAHTPTMRVPKSIVNTGNIYYAMKAMLRQIDCFNRMLPNEKTIETVACPGLGTLSGQVPVKIAAEQMALAYKHFNNPPKNIDWEFASRRNQEISAFEPETF